MILVLTKILKKIAGEECESSFKGKRKGGQYHQYEPEFRYKVAKHVAEFGKAAAKKMCTIDII